MEMGAPLQDQPLEWEQKVRPELLQFNGEPAGPGACTHQTLRPQLPGHRACWPNSQGQDCWKPTELGRADPWEPQPRDTA